MHILILGGGGFLGQKLAKQLITNQSITVNGVPGQITKIELLDRFWPQHKVEDPILIYTQGDITDTTGRGLCEYLCGIWWRGIQGDR